MENLIKIKEFKGDTEYYVVSDYLLYDAKRKTVYAVLPSAIDEEDLQNVDITIGIDKIESAYVVLWSMLVGELQNLMGYLDELE